MTPTEAQRQIDHASNRVSEIGDELKTAKQALRDVVDRVGLVLLELSDGETVTCYGKRYSVYGAMWAGAGRVRPRGRIIKKDGTVGEREMPDFGAWERENVD